MKVLTIDQEIVFRFLMGLDITQADSKKFCVNSRPEDFAKVKSMIDAYSGMIKRINNFQWSSFETNFKDSDGDMDQACPDPNTFPEMEVFRSMILAIFKSIAKRYI